MKSNLTLLSLLSLIFLSSFTISPGNSKMEGEMVGEEVYFSAALLQQMMTYPGCDAVRFYTANSLETGAGSLMAICTSGGADMTVNENPISNYHLFDGLGESSAIITPLDKAAARQACLAVSKSSRFAVTLGNSEIEELLGAPGANGIKLVQVTDNQGNKTLSASAVTLSDGQLYSIQGSPNMTNQSPCPNSCGEDPGLNYLVNLME